MRRSGADSADTARTPAWRSGSSSPTTGSTEPPEVAEGVAPEGGTRPYCVWLRPGPRVLAGPATSTRTDDRRCERDEGVPMAGPRPALVRRARRLLGYWRSEIRTLRQGLAALILSTAAGFVAGLILAYL